MNAWLARARYLCGVCNEHAITVIRHIVNSRPRNDVEGSTCNVETNAWLSIARYPSAREHVLNYNATGCDFRVPLIGRDGIEGSTCNVEMSASLP
jgi:hypothetical protein